MATLSNQYVPAHLHIYTQKKRPPVPLSKALKPHVLTQRPASPPYSSQGGRKGEFHLYKDQESLCAGPYFQESTEQTCDFSGECTFTCSSIQVPGGRNELTGRKGYLVASVGDTWS